MTDGEGTMHWGGHETWYRVVGELDPEAAPTQVVICHGGPGAMPKDAQFVFERVDGVDGFYGASSMERLPTELALTEADR